MYSFTLIHYTEGWHAGSRVTLSAIPPLGTLVKADSSGNPEGFDDIYYVDNVLFADGGENYLFVRPYEGYGLRAPMTESDRIQESIRELTSAVDNLGDNVMEQLQENR